MISIEEIKSFFEGEILINEPLSKYTSLRIGGPADLFLFPDHNDDIVKLIAYLNSGNIPSLIIGNGTNLLVSDSGFRGAVINLGNKFNKIEMRNSDIQVQSGVMLTRFVDFCINHKKQGVEKLAGIPGTVGGAIVMNAGAWGAQISDYIVDIEVIRNDEIIKVSKKDAGFAYRRSDFGNDIILSGRFNLPEGNIDEMLKARTEYLQKRNYSHPVNYPNCGSVFKNPPGHYVAKLIEEAGLKGLKVGGAQISEKHANFIINTGDATAQDVVQLIKRTSGKVFEKFNISPELEIKLVGFDEDIFTNG